MFGKKINPRRFLHDFDKYLLWGLGSWLGRGLIHFGVFFSVIYYFL